MAAGKANRKGKVEASSSVRDMWASGVLIPAVSCRQGRGPALMASFLTFGDPLRASPREPKEELVGQFCVVSTSETQGLVDTGAQTGGA